MDFSAALSADRFVEAGEFVHVDPLVEGVGHTHLLTIHPSLTQWESQFNLGIQYGRFSPFFSFFRNCFSDHLGGTPLY